MKDFYFINKVLRTRDGSRLNTRRLVKLKKKVGDRKGEVLLYGIGSYPEGLLIPYSSMSQKTAHSLYRTYLRRWAY